MLGIEELLELEDSLRIELNDNLTGILTNLNRTDQLEMFLSLIGMEHLLAKDDGYQVYKSGKIVVIGQSDVKAEVLLSIGKKLGIEKERFELYLDYEDAKHFTLKRCNGNLPIVLFSLALCRIVVFRKVILAVSSLR